MYNLLISLAITAACFLIGWVVTGSVVAGVIPGLLGFGIGYFMLGRRTLRQLQALMAEGQKVAHLTLLDSWTPDRIRRIAPQNELASLFDLSARGLRVGSARRWRCRGECG